MNDTRPVSTFLAVSCLAVAVVGTFQAFEHHAQVHEQNVIRIDAENVIYNPAVVPEVEVGDADIIIPEVRITSRKPAVPNKCAKDAVFAWRESDIGGQVRGFCP